MTETVDDTINRLYRERDEARARAETAEAALVRYGGHLASCPNRENTLYACDCGFVEMVEELFPGRSYPVPRVLAGEELEAVLRAEDDRPEPGEMSPQGEERGFSRTELREAIRRAETAEAALREAYIALRDFASLVPPDRWRVIHDESKRVLGEARALAPSPEGGNEDD